MDWIEEIIKDNWQPVFKPIDECDFSDIAQAIRTEIEKRYVGKEEVRNSTMKWWRKLLNWLADKIFEDVLPKEEEQ